MIRVLHVAGGVEPELGGPAVAIVNYVRASAAPDVEAHLLVAVDGPAELPHGVGITTVRRTGRFRGRAKLWGISIPLALWMTRHASGFDVIVVHGAWLFSSLAGLVAAKLARKPCVMIPHESLTDFDIHKPGSDVRIRAKRAIERVYAANCGVFIFASEMERTDSLTRGTTARTAVIPCPIFEGDRAFAQPRPAKALRTPLRIGFLGRFHPKKQLDVLIEALSLLPSEVTLIAGGDGPDPIRAELRTLAANLAVGDRIVWRGFVASRDKDAFFESIDVLVMPSEYESFGVVAAEAMHRGVPAIVSPRTGIAELISSRGGGLIVQPVARTLAEALTNLSENPEKLSELSQQASHAAEQLTFSRIGSLLRDEYLRLAGR